MTGQKTTIRFGTVEIPKALYEAQVAKRLVVFAGAGVSMPSPSSLPNFEGLAKVIATGMTVTRRADETVDRFIGRIENMDVDVRQITHDTILKAGSTPTRLHKAILSLFPSADDVRIVTTNYDPHLTTAFKEHFNENPEEFSAPALPLGHSFSGIAYLHGSIIRRNWRDIVLTDRDFGKGYITEGWATRFLQDLFNTYTILFVGYSHTDFIVNYLTRGLSGKGIDNRYILTVNVDIDGWKHLGVKPVLYVERPSETEDTHIAVPEAVEVWSQHLRWEGSDHEKFVKDTVSRPPPMDDQVLDRIRFVLERDDLIQYFVNTADSSEWLNWIEDEGYLVPLFESEVASQKSGGFAFWLTKKFACQQPELLMSILHRNKNRIYSVLWGNLASELWRKPRPEISDANFHIWIQLLLGSVPRTINTQILDYLLQACRFPEDKQSASILFIWLTRPTPKLSSGWTIDPETKGVKKKVDIDVSFHGDQHWIDNCWGKYFKPNLAQLAEDLFEPLVGNLRQAYLLVEGSRRDLNAYDPLSRSRSAIEPSGQDAASKDLLHELISAVRDIIEHFGSAGNRDTLTYIQSWKTNRHAIFRRLAVHATKSLPYSTASEKILWLSQFDVTDVNSHHEIFKLIEATYKDADEDARRAFISRVETWDPPQLSDTDDQRHAYYAIAQMLDWTVKADPNCSLAKSAFEAAKAKVPGYLPTRHPEYLSYIESGWGSGESSPYTAAELLKLDLDKEFDSLCDWRPQDKYDRRTRFLTEVEKACDQDTRWRDKLLDLLAKSKNANIDLWRPVFSSLCKTDLSDETWALVLDQADLLSAELWNAESLVSFLTEKVRKEGGVPAHLLLKVFEASEKLWDKVQVPYDDDDWKEDGKVDWFSRAINHFGGKVAELWTHLLSRYVNQDKNKGLLSAPKPMLERFTAVVEGDERKSDTALVMFASYLSFFFNVAYEWAEATLIPTLDWSRSEEKATVAWQGYLFHHRLSEKLLPTLLSKLPELYKHLDNLGRYREQLCRFIAGVCVSVEYDPYQIIHQFLDNVTEEDAAHWAHQIQIELESMPEGERVKHWDRWIEHYWSQRKVGKPQKLRMDELREMYDWALTSPYILSKAVPLICGVGAPSVGQRFLLNNLEESPLVQSNPSDVVALAVHLLGTTQESYDYDSIAKVVRTIVASGAAAEHSVNDQLQFICKTLATRQVSGVAELLQVVTSSRKTE